MKIDVGNLKRQGKSEEQFDMSVQLDNNLSLSPEIAFKNGKFVGKLFISDKVTVQGELTYTAEGSCSRCLEPAEQVVTEEISAVYSERPEQDEYMYKSGTIDFSELISDTLLYSQPSVLLCKSGCKGLCNKCGCNLNEKTCNCVKD